MTITPRESVNHIIDNGDRFPITLDYANKGFEEGWLVLVHYWIDTMEVEHCEYEHVPPP